MRVTVGLSVVLGLSLVGLAWAAARLGLARIEGCGCWEIPLAFTARRHGRLILFHREFDAARGDYGTEYRAYELPALIGSELRDHWPELPAWAVRPLGAVQVSAVRFEGPGGRYVRTGLLDSLLGLAG
jgi:hypothetical protein